MIAWPGYSGVGASPVVSPNEDVLYYLSNNGQLRAYEYDGTLLWSVSVGSNKSSPAVGSDGTLYISLANGNLIAVDPSNGGVNWTFSSCGSDSYSTPAIGLDGTVYYTDFTTGIVCAVNLNGTEKWQFVADGGDIAGTGVFAYGDVISIDSFGNLYVHLDKIYSLSPAGSLRWSMGKTTFKQITIGSDKILYLGRLYAVKPWELSASVGSQGNYIAGHTMTITANTSMLQTDPDASEDNQVQVVMPNGDKVPLTYSSISDGNTIWTGTYTIPAGTTDGAYTATVEAGAYNVVTDVTTIFASAPTGSTNTGITNTLSYTVDNTAPTGSVSIASGATFTTTPSVTLNLLATDASSGVNRMLISQSSDFIGAMWETYATTKPFTLSSGDGTKTVYVMFEDVAGNVSTTYSDTIILDSTSPIDEVSINSGATYTVSRDVTLTIAASDATAGLNRMLISEDATFIGATWETYTVTKVMTLSSGDGEKTIYIRFEDVAGNVSTVFTDTIILDTVSPTGLEPAGTIQIGGGVTHLNNHTANLSFATTDVTAGLNRMLISESSDFVGATWETFSISKVFTLSSGDGKKTVYVKFEDKAGNVSTVFSATVTVDTSTPTLVLTKLNTLNVNPNIFTYYYTTGKNLTITGTTEPNATVTITVNSDPIVCTTVADSSGNFSCTFATTIPTGTHTVNITATDAAGNSITYPEMTLGIAVGLAATGSPALLSLLTLPLLGGVYVVLKKRLEF